MNLHIDKESFNDLIIITAKERGIPESAVKRDYYIVMVLQKLEQSEYAENCVFKGGTSLSKCYPGSIERFSEDIDLTFITEEDLSDKQYSRKIKQIETIMSVGATSEKINAERNNRNKSSMIWFDDDVDTRIKLEIGSSVRPDPYEKRTLKTYIQEHLEKEGMTEAIEQIDLKPVTINTLNIERTFLDKLFSVKRHAICGTLNKKVRHIYDVTRLYDMKEIQEFLLNKDELKRLVELTKKTDSFYLEKRNISKDYRPDGNYSFEEWGKYFDDSIQDRYEKLHEDLLYTDEKQNFLKAIETFEKINGLFKEIEE